MSSKDHPSLVIGALQLVDLLLQKLPTEYRPVLRREGVFHEIESYAAKTLTSVRSKDSDSAVIAEHASIPIHGSSAIPGYKKLHSLSLEPEDAITLRARIIRFKYSLGQEEGDEDNAFDQLRRLVDRLVVPDVGESVMISALRDIADHFTSHLSVSSFELLQSGAVDGLLRFATDSARSSGMNLTSYLVSQIHTMTVTIKRRQELLYDAFSRIPRGGTVNQSSLAVLVKKLQESLTRMEDFDVVTVSQGADGKYDAYSSCSLAHYLTDSKRSSPSLLARQLRLRLVADDESDIPRNLRNMVVSIHAIATFQALNDYLRPRITGLMSTGGLPGMLAALAASGFGPATSRNPLEAPTQPSKPAESSSAPKTASETPATGSSEVGRRRSLRLSAKNGGLSVDGGGNGTITVPTIDAGPTASSSSASAPQSTAHRMEALIQDSGLVSDFTDDEVDAEVISPIQAYNLGAD